MWSFREYINLVDSELLDDDSDMQLAIADSLKDTISQDILQQRYAHSSAHVVLFLGCVHDHVKQSVNYYMLP